MRRVVIDLKNYVHLNEVLKKIAKNNPMTGFVSAEGLTANPDNLHFNAKSLYEFGIRYFKEYENFEMGERIKEHSDYNDEFRTKKEML